MFNYHKKYQLLNLLKSHYDAVLSNLHLLDYSKMTVLLHNTKTAIKC